MRTMSDATILHDRVRATLDSAGIAYEPLECAPELADTAEFCAHYGIAAEEACNAIVVVVKSTPRRYLACLVRADTKLDVNKKVAAIAGTKKLSFASSEETAELTGMLIGGGNRSSKARVAPSELLKLPNASVADVAVPR